MPGARRPPRPAYRPCPGGRRDVGTREAPHRADPHRHRAGQWSPQGHLSVRRAPGPAPLPAPARPGAWGRDQANGRRARGCRPPGAPRGARAVGGVRLAPVRRGPPCRPRARGGPGTDPRLQDPSPRALAAPDPGPALDRLRARLHDRDVASAPLPSSGVAAPLRGSSRGGVRTPGETAARDGSPRRPAGAPAQRGRARRAGHPAGSGHLPAGAPHPAGSPARGRDRPHLLGEGPARVPGGIRGRERRVAESPRGTGGRRPGRGVHRGADRPDGSG